MHVVSLWNFKALLVGGILIVGQCATGKGPEASPMYPQEDFIYHWEEQDNITQKFSYYQEGKEKRTTEGKPHRPRPQGNHGKSDEKTNGGWGSSGKVVKHRFEVAYFPWAPDGVSTKVLGINGQFPCPTIYATEGDIVEIDVVNTMQPGINVNTSIHWHGILQKGSIFEDGTSHITQCPIRSGKRRLHKFQVKQSGTYWYHSHLRSQYTEGLWGALVIKPKKEVYPYDKEFIITLSDWYHTTGKQNEEWFLSQRSQGNPPYPFSALMNGLGRYNCDVAKKLGRSCNRASQKRPVFHLHPSKTYKVRLISSSSWSSFNFSIDGHTLRVVEVDGQYLHQPSDVEAIHVSAGQRYAFLLKRKQPNDRTREYLARGYLRRDFLFRDPKVVNINPKPDDIYDLVTGCIRYGNEEKDLHNLMSQESFDYTQRIPPSSLNINKAKFLNDLELKSVGGDRPPSKYDKEIKLSIFFGNDAAGIRRGSFNAKPYVLPGGPPLIYTMLQNQPFPKGTQNYDVQLGHVVQILINNPFNGSHPIHLHGHSFWVMAAGQIGDGNYNPQRHSLTYLGLKRDTEMVKERSHLVIRFVADNPGLWILHCHIDWHMLGGMLITMSEGADVARKQFKMSEADKQLCRDHGINIK